MKMAGETAIRYHWSNTCETRTVLKDRKFTQRIVKLFTHLNSLTCRGHKFFRCTNVSYMHSNNVLESWKQLLNRARGIRWLLIRNLFFLLLLPFLFYIVFIGCALMFRTNGDEKYFTVLNLFLATVKYLYY